MTAKPRAGLPASAPAAGPVAIRLPDKREFPPPQAVNFFTFSWNGPEVQLLAGYLDLQPPQTEVPPTEVVPEITHRLVMSVRGLAILKHQLDEAASLLAAAGVSLEQLDPMWRPPTK